MSEEFFVWKTDRDEMKLTNWLRLICCRELLLSFADENGRVHRETILQEIAEVGVHQ